MEINKKEILINNNTLWVDIQSSFAGHYPFLKIEISEKEKGLRMSRHLRIDNPFCVKLTTAEASCTIDISNERSVLEVASDFKNYLGLDVEVLRKSGNVWNVISLTGNWTLENQNEAGRFICSQMLDSL